ncbi:hypothetical protein CHARACLAT_004260, partial [Characodon lateralis]|nr:hypothetical protein [Characodon lateralis]
LGGQDLQCGNDAVKWKVLTYLGFHPAGFSVPKDYGAVYISYFIHRDPEVFQQSDSFFLERLSGRNASQEHLLCSFGNGPRSCTGSTHQYLPQGSLQIPVKELRLVFGSFISGP